MNNLISLIKLHNVLDIYIEFEEDKIEKYRNSWTVSEFNFHLGKKDAFLKVQDEIEKIIDFSVDK